MAILLQLSDLSPLLQPCSCREVITHVKRTRALCTHGLGKRSIEMIMAE